MLFREEARISLYWCKRGGEERRGSLSEELF